MRVNFNNYPNYLNFGQNILPKKSIRDISSNAFEEHSKGIEQRAFDSIESAKTLSTATVEEIEDFKNKVIKKSQKINDEANKIIQDAQNIISDAESSFNSSKYSKKPRYGGLCTVLTEKDEKTGKKLKEITYKTDTNDLYEIKLFNAPRGKVNFIDLNSKTKTQVHIDYKVKKEVSFMVNYITSCRESFTFDNMNGSLLEYQSGFYRNLNHQGDSYDEYASFSRDVNERLILNEYYKNGKSTDSGNTAEKYVSFDDNGNLSDIRVNYFYSPRSNSTSASDYIFMNPNSNQPLLYAKDCIAKYSTETLKCGSELKIATTYDDKEIAVYSEDVVKKDTDFADLYNKECASVGSKLTITV